MLIGIVTPAPPSSRYGNQITARRWAGILRELGHRVNISQEYAGEPFDILLALHARRSYQSIRRFHNEHPGKPLIVALTGTDLYRDLRKYRKAQVSLELASRIIILQPKALEELRPEAREKARVIFQSVSDKSKRDEHHRPRKSVKGVTQTFDICVVGHLRSVKDPFRAARAARLLSRSSRIRVLHVGQAMTKNMEESALAEMKINPRYKWLGEQPQGRAKRILADSDLCILSSRMEGGANVLSEAIVASVPILASKIAGTIGILGEDYPGYFAVSSTTELAQLMIRAETEPSFLKELTRWCKRLAPQFFPEREKRAWSALLRELPPAK